MSEFKADLLLVEGAPDKCNRCLAKLCLRKQVVNLALGNSEQMFCLECLAIENKQTKSEVLLSIKDYILSRECFAKPWQKYKTKEFCPDPSGCVPVSCFGESKGSGESNV